MQRQTDAARFAGALEADVGARPAEDALHLAPYIAMVGVEDVVGAEAFCGFEPFIEKIDGNDRVGAGKLAELHCQQADYALTDYHRALAQPHRPDEDGVQSDCAQTHKDVLFQVVIGRQRVGKNADADAAGRGPDLGADPGRSFWSRDGAPIPSRCRRPRARSLPPRPPPRGRHPRNHK